MKDFGTSQSPKSTRPLTTYLCPSRPGHQALRNNFASSLLLRTWLPMTGRRVRRPTLFSLWRKARRENSAASRLLGSTSLRFALHGWQRLKMKQIFLIAIVSIAAIAGYNKYQNNKMMSALQPEMDSAVNPHSTTPSSNSSNTNSDLTYSCDGRVYCSEMNSCEEATFFLNNCPNTKMDGDYDGIPCENQWCSR